VVVAVDDYCYYKYSIKLYGDGFTAEWDWLKVPYDITQVDLERLCKYFDKAVIAIMRERVERALKVCGYNAHLARAAEVLQVLQVLYEVACPA